MARHMASGDCETYRVVLEYQFREHNPAWLWGVDQPGVPEFLDELGDVIRSVAGPYRTMGAARAQRSRQKRDALGAGTYYEKARVFVRQYVERAETKWAEVPE